MANYKNSPTSVLRDGGSTKVNRNWHDRYQENSTSLPVGRVVPLLCEYLQGNSNVKLDIASAVQTNPTSSPVFGRMSVDLQTFYCPLRLYVVGLYGNNLLENDFVDEISFPLSQIGSSLYASIEQYTTCFVGHGSLLSHLRYPRHIIGTYISDYQPLTGVQKDISMPLNPKARPLDDFAVYYENSVSGEESVTTPYLPPKVYNAIPILAYLDACVHYYADPFDRDIPFEVTTCSLEEDELDNINLVINRTLLPVPYESIITLLYEAKGFSVPAEQNNIPNGVLDPAYISLAGDSSDILRLLPLIETPVGYFNRSSQLESIDLLAQMTFNDGLFPTTFKPDLMTTWYDDEQVLKLTSNTQFEGGNYTALRLAQAEFNRLANYMIKGQTYDDFVGVTYGSEYRTQDSPIRLAVDSYDIRFQDIVNTAARTGQGEVPLGTPVARGYAASDSYKTIEFETLEPGYLLVLGSLVPSVKYTEDVPAHLSYVNLGDTPNRFYDGAAFQSLLLGDAWNTGTSLDDMSLGQQPFYYEHMISYDRVSGLLATEGFKSYNFIRDFDLSGFVWSPRSDGFSELSSVFADNYRSKYVNGSLFDYAFPANAPVTLGEAYEAIASATAQNYYFVFRFDLRVLEPLTNQVITRATL